MSDHIYKKVELVGSSKTSIEDAITGAIARASRTLRNLDWFEVKEVRGAIQNGEVAWYQVSLALGFRVLDPADLQEELQPAMAEEGRKQSAEDIEQILVTDQPAQPQA